MKKILLFSSTIILFVVIYTACDIYDISNEGIPKFVRHDFIELPKIKLISKFRSGAGHSYTDNFEKCRSMKHYYSLTLSTAPSTTDSANIYSPVDGTIIRVINENNASGIQLWIKSSKYKAFVFRIFHVFSKNNYTIGQTVEEGELLGKSTGTDIAVTVNQFLSTRSISYFEVMTDELFNEYQQRGINHVNDMIITKEYRNANPCTCNGEEFITVPDPENNWVSLN